MTMNVVFFDFVEKWNELGSIQKRIDTVLRNFEENQKTQDQRKVLKLWHPVLEMEKNTEVSSFIC